MIKKKTMGKAQKLIENQFFEVCVTQVDGIGRCLIM